MRWIAGGSQPCTKVIYQLDHWQSFWARIEVIWGEIQVFRIGLRFRADLQPTADW